MDIHRHTHTRIQTQLSAQLSAPASPPGLDYVRWRIKEELQNIWAGLRAHQVLFAPGMNEY